MSLNSEGRSETLGGWSGNFAIGSAVLKKLIAGVDTGHIVIVTPRGMKIEHRGENPGPEAVVKLRNWRAMRRLVTGGDVGFAESYIDGDWTSPDITALIEFVAINSASFESSIDGLLPIRALRRLHHLLRPNSKARSRRNIAFHYDLGNRFFRLWLDRGMNYSSALYARPGQSLEDAQESKLSRIVELLGLAGGERILEIGCGWGTLAARLAHLGSSVTALTLSSEQLAYADGQMRKQNLGDRVDVRLQDYRDAEGQFDRIVSIEMLEAVGEKYWPVYYDTLRKRLKPGATAVIQAITIDERRFEAYRKGADFVQKHIFPGGMLPSKAAIAEQAAHAGLALVSVETFGESYALTLAEWRRRFLASWPDVEKLGFDASFRRLWEYYLCYCEAGFRTKAIDVGLYVLKR